MLYLLHVIYMNFLIIFVIFEACISSSNMTISPLKIFWKIFQLTIDLSHLFINNRIYLWEMKSNSAPYWSPQLALTAHK